MLRHALAIALVSLAGCVYVPTKDVLDGPPPAFESLSFDSSPQGCVSHPGQAAFQFSASDRLGIPPAIVNCDPHMPPVLVAAHVQGLCLSMFDLDAAGAPANVVTRCTVGHPQRELDEAWQAFAKKAFSQALEISLAETRYPAVDTQRQERRTNISKAALFVVQGDPPSVKPVRPFQREGAPPLPADLH